MHRSFCWFCHVSVQIETSRHGTKRIPVGNQHIPSKVNVFKPLLNSPTFPQLFYKVCFYSYHLCLFVFLFISIFIGKAVAYVCDFSCTSNILIMVQVLLVLYRHVLILFIILKFLLLSFFDFKSSLTLLELLM